MIPRPPGILPLAGMLVLLLLTASCASRRMYPGARANIYLPLPETQGVEETQVREAWEKEENGEQPAVVHTKNQDGHETAYVPDRGDEGAGCRLPAQPGGISVTAGVRNAPERLGKVEVDFVVSVPRELINSRWQLNLSPRLVQDGQVLEFPQVTVSGEGFRRMQMKQYARYEKYLSKIVPDSLFERHFLKRGPWRRYIAAHNAAQRRKARRDSLNHLGYARYIEKMARRYDCFNEKSIRRRKWLAKVTGMEKAGERYILSGGEASRVDKVRRGLHCLLDDLLPVFWLRRDFAPQYMPRKYRDGRYDGEFESGYDPVTASDSVFLKKMFLKKRRMAKNRHLIDNKHIAFATMVTHPLNGRAMPDTVVSGREAFEYHYRGEVTPGQDGRMSVYMDGYILTTGGDSRLLPRSDTLEYATSSILQLEDTAPRFMREIVPRKTVSSLQAHITFRTGRHEVDARPGGNRAQPDRVRDMLDTLTRTGEFVLDSITLSGGCSPEGGFSSNMRLAGKRGRAIGEYLAERLAGVEGIRPMCTYSPKGEDWQGLLKLATDSLRGKNRQAILDIIASEDDPDRKEAALQRKYPAEYRYIRGRLYPQLRAVELTFHVHRREMESDTIPTTRPDTVYAAGMELMAGHRYADALHILRGYNDYNTAVCLMSLGEDRAAYPILSGGPETANREYLLAIIASRLGREQEAVTRYRRSVELDPAKRRRGRLDPEINKLFRAYHPDQEENSENNDTNIQ